MILPNPRDPSTPRHHAPRLYAGGAGTFAMPGLSPNLRPLAAANSPLKPGNRPEAVKEIAPQDVKEMARPPRNSPQGGLTGRSGGRISCHRQLYESGRDSCRRSGLQGRGEPWSGSAGIPEALAARWAHWEWPAGGEVWCRGWPSGGGGSRSGRWCCSGRSPRRWRGALRLGDLGRAGYCWSSPSGRTSPRRPT